MFACGDAEQALLWLLRTDALGADGRIDRTHSTVDLRVSVPDLHPGDYQITYWDTEHGFVLAIEDHDNKSGGALSFSPPPIMADIAIAVRRKSDSGAEGSSTITLPRSRTEQ
jgi:hypothetical protein